LNEYYKKHFVLVDTDTSTIYATCCKSYPKIYIYHTKGKWNISQDIQSEDYKLSMTTNTVINDIVIKDNIMIYKLFLGSLSKYKLSDLQTIAQEQEVSIKQENGKLKLKAQLYRDINLIHV